jgi:hypothetical protein
VLSGANAGDNLSLKDAHPSATVVRDPAKVSAAEQRLLPEKP